MNSEPRDNSDMAIGPHPCPECGRDCYCSTPDYCEHECDAAAREAEEDRKQAEAKVKLWDED